MLLEHTELMFTIITGIGFGGCDQIIQSALRHVWQHSALPGPHGDSEANPPALHLVSLPISLVAGIRIDHGLLAVQEISRWGEVMHIGRRGFHWV